MGYCNFCGKLNPNGSKFCNYCGKQMFGEIDETIKYDNYSVSLFSIGNNKTKVVNALQKWFNCPIEDAYKMLDNLPILLNDNCDEKTALNIVKDWQRLGAGVRHTTEDDTHIDEEESVDKTLISKTPIITNTTKPKKETNAKISFSKPQLFKLVSSLLFFVGTILFLFLPLFYDNSTVNEKLTRNPYSLFYFVYNYSKGLISGEIKISFTNYGIIYILATAMCFAVWCTTAFSTIKAVIIDARNSKFGNNPSFKSKIGLKSMLSLAGNFLIMFFFMSFDGLIYLNVIIIAVIVIVATILEKIALK